MSPSFQLKKKKNNFSVCIPLLLRIGASPINPSDILLHHLRSSAVTTRLHEKHSRAGCQRTRAYCWMRLRVDPVVDLIEESAVCGLLCEDGVQAGLDAGSICQRLRRIMQASIMNDLVPGFRFPEDFCGFPTILCSCLHTPLDLSSLLLQLPRRRLLRSKCCEDVGINLEMSTLSHIHLTAGPQEVDTRGARLSMATLRRAFGIGGNGLCAQTLGQLASNLPEFCFNVQPRTACRRTLQPSSTLHCGS